MGDIKCTHCGEPWDASFLRDGLQSELEDLDEMGE